MKLLRSLGPLTLNREGGGPGDHSLPHTSALPLALVLPHPPALGQTGAKEMGKQPTENSANSGSDPCRNRSWRWEQIAEEAKEGPGLPRLGRWGEESKPSPPPLLPWRPPPTPTTLSSPSSLGKVRSLRTFNSILMSSGGVPQAH